MEFYELKNNECHSKNGMWMICVRNGIYRIYVKDNGGDWIFVAQYLECILKDKNVLEECKRYINYVCNYSEGSKNDGEEGNKVYKSELRRIFQDQ